MKDALTLPANVQVREVSGAYVTATVAGQRASSTSSAETAMVRLVDKLTLALLLSPGNLVAKPLAAKGLAAGVSMWRIDVNQGAVA